MSLPGGAAGSGSGSGSGSRAFGTMSMRLDAGYAGWENNTYSPTKSPM